MTSKSTSFSLRKGILALSLSAALVPAALWAAAPARPAADTDYTGVVGDTMCGVKHSMGDNPTDCTRMCASGTDGYALIVGTKAYALVGVTKAEAAVLYKEAGKRVVVKGTLAGNKLTVHSVAPAKA